MDRPFSHIDNMDDSSTIVQFNSRPSIFLRPSILTPYVKLTFSWFNLYSIFFTSIFSSVEQIHSFILRNRFNLKLFHNCAYFGNIFGLVPVSRPILSNNVYYSNIKGIAAAEPRDQNRNVT